MKKQYWVGVVAVLAAAASSQAAVMWAVPAGMTPTFEYLDGQSINGKSGDGMPTDYGFTFNPTQFVAAANGVNTPVTTTDTSSVTIDAYMPMLSITGTFFGDYSILGTGSVTASGTLTATNLDTLAVVSAPFLVSGVPASTTTSAAGGFFATTTINLPGGWTDFDLDMTATVNATAGVNGVALIENKSGEIVIRAKLIPEPTSLLAVSGLLGLAGRRSRR